MPDDVPPQPSPAWPPDDAGRRRGGSRSGASGRPSHDPPTVRGGYGGGAGAAVPAGPLGGSSGGGRVRPVAGQPPWPPLPLPRVGEAVGTFRLEEAIGAGGMGAVFRALDERLDRQVALKVLPPEQAHDPEVVRRFYQEGRAAARLDHENIARVYTIGYDGRAHYIAFEYIEGVTVRQRVDGLGPTPAGEAIDLTLQIAGALVHAAARGVVHRDIKPSNIVVTRQGRAKLVDMGLARRFELGGDDGLTQSGMTLGTFDYISPEQARDPRDVDVRSDLYSLGCTLFHMLTGRPPFPDGTVLQKLIQHREEPAPDVRSLTPGVPAGLAVVVLKLMAKDRDRRYQTPEQLARDLLAVAGAAGLGPPGPPAAAWAPAAPPPSWERHLVWAVPSLAFAAVVAALVWWGQEAATVPPNPAAPVPGDGPPPLLAEASAPAPAPAPVPTATVGVTPGAGRASASAGSGSAHADPADGGGAGREVPVKATADLLAVLASAPARSVVVLVDDGPYDLGGLGRAGRLAGLDLTVKAGPGARPVLRDAGGRSSGGATRPALLDFDGGRVTLDGLAFETQGADPLGPAAAVRAEDAELTVRRCLFRRPPGSGSGSGIGAEVGREGVGPVRARGDSAVAVVASGRPGADGERPARVALEGSHFEGGWAGVRATGPVDLLVRDCTFATAEPALWLDNRGPTPVPADLRLRHVSVLLGAAPALRVDGTDARVWVDDSVVSAASSTPATGVDGLAAPVPTTLAAVDRPGQLAWRGRGNLYGRVDQYLSPTATRPGQEAVRDPAAWRETGDEVRETDTTFLPRAAWAEPDPARSLGPSATNPTRAFRLAADHPGAGDLGARLGPGTLAAAGPVSPAANPPAPPGREPVDLAGAIGSTTGSARTAAAAVAPTVAVAGPPRVVVEEDAEALAGRSGMGELPVVPVMPPTDAAPDRPAGDRVAAAVGGARGEAGGRKGDDAAGVLRTADQLVSALNEVGARGGALRLAADADWDLAGVRVRPSGVWSLRAEPGATRPRLRFLPGPADPPSPAAWAALFDARGGSLRVEGVDIVLPELNAPRQGRWAAFLAGPDTDLSLVNCTVTVEGDRAGSSVVAVEPAAAAADADPMGNDVGPAAATVRMTDTLARTGGDGLDVGPGGRLVLEMDNAAAATGGSLVHAHGRARGPTPERLGLTLRQVTLRAGGGLLHLDAGPGEPELPAVEVNVRDSILATAPNDAPLVRVDAQDDLAASRDKVVWEGHGVAYYRMTTYRRDQSAQVGTVPTLYDRAGWSVAAGARELFPYHGDLKFRTPWTPARPAWSLRRDDLVLARDNPGPAAGPDRARLPDPPLAP